MPLALDWDRPWQAYPLPPAFGAIAGYIVGSGAGLLVSIVMWLVSKETVGKKVV
jgi:phosphatidylinositol glycan class F